MKTNSLVTNKLKEEDFVCYPPNEEGTNRYLRKDGHSTSDSLNEIIDNAIDQKATKVWIDIVNKKDKVFLVIRNNGNPVQNWEGMLTLGGNTKRDNESIGNYGVGLKHFLSFFPEILVYSKKNNVPELHHKTPKNKEQIPSKLKEISNGGFIFRKKVLTNDPSFEIAESLLKKTSTGVAIVLEINEEQKEKWSNPEVYTTCSQSYFFHSINLYFNGKKLKKENPLGNITLIDSPELKSHEGLKFEYFQTDKEDKNQERRGLYVSMHGRLINIKGKSFMSHATYNGHILLLHVPGWSNSAITSGDLDIINQKNSFDLKEGSALYKELDKITETYRNQVSTPTREKNKVIKEITSKGLESLPIQKTQELTDEGNIVDKKTKKVVGTVLDSKELERYLQEEFGTTLKKVYGHDHKIASGRYFKKEKSLDLNLRIFDLKKQHIPLQGLFYDLEVLKEFSQKTKLKINLFVQMPPKESSTEVSKVISRLKALGVKFL